MVSFLCGSKKNTKCTLCNEKMKKTDRAILPCGHQFCLVCIIEQYKCCNICPHCYKKISVFDNKRKTPMITQANQQVIPKAQPIPITDQQTSIVRNVVEALPQTQSHLSSSHVATISTDHPITNIHNQVNINFN